jgi:type IV pili sensor histidine kinase/response regulator
VKIINPGDVQPSDATAASSPVSNTKPAAETKPATQQTSAGDLPGTIEVKTPTVAAVQAGAAITPAKNEVAHSTPVPEKPKWEAAAGSTLRATVEAWSARAGWTLRWEADDLNYPIDVAFQMEGQFTDVVSTTFDLYRTAGRPFRVTLYAPQHLMVVREQK